MRVARKEPAIGPQPDITPFDAGRQAYLAGLSVDYGLRRFGITDRMRDATESFCRGFDVERSDEAEMLHGGEVDHGDGTFTI